MSVISSLRLWRPLANISCQNGFIVIGRKYSTDLGRYVKIVFYHKTLYPLDFDIIHIRKITYMSSRYQHPLKYLVHFRYFRYFCLIVLIFVKNICEIT